MIAGVLLDLDGVLVRTDEYNFRAWKTLAERLQIPFTRQDNERCRGISRMASLEILLEKAPRAYSLKEKEELCQEKNAIYLSLLDELSPASLLPGVKETLPQLKALGLHLAIASSSKNARYVLEKIGYGDFFDAVVDGTMVTRAKPDPEIFLLAAKKLGLQSAECVVVEDAEAGIQAAKKGGFLALGISYAEKVKECDGTLKDFSALLDWVKALRKV